MPGITVNPDGTPHVHEYVRRKSVKTGKPTNIFACAHPNCYSSYHRKLLKGKESLCAVCHKNKIILTMEDLKRAFPRCKACSTTKVAETLKHNKDILESLGIK